MTGVQTCALPIFISQGQGIYFSRPEKHPFPGRKSTQFPFKNHYILWFHPSFFSKTTIRHLNYRSLMWCCGGIDACIYIILLIHWNTIYPLTIHSPERLFPLLTIYLITIYLLSCNSAILQSSVLQCAMKLLTPFVIPFVRLFLQETLP